MFFGALFTDDAQVVANDATQFIVSRVSEDHYGGIDGLVRGIQTRQATLRRFVLSNVGFEYNAYGDALAQALARCPNLESVDLSNTLLTVVGLRILAPFFYARAGALREIILKDNKTLRNQGAYVLSSFVVGCANLEVLNLENTGIEERGALSLADALRDKYKLRVLIMNFNNTGDTGGAALIRSLRGRATLAVLELENTYVGPQSLREFDAFWPDWGENLEVLNLRGNFEFAPGGMPGGLFETSNGAKLKSLDVSNIGYSVAGSKKLLTRLMRMPLEALRNLDVSDNAMDQDCAWILCRILMMCPNLDTLEVRGAGFGDTGTRIVLNQCCTAPRLLELGLFRNNAETLSATGVHNLLRENKTLQVLALHGNMFTDSDVVEIAAGLAQNKRLKKLDLSLNEFTAAGARDLARAVLNHPALEHLNVYQNQLGNGGGAAFHDLIAQSTRLRELDLESTGLGDEDALAIAAALPASKSIARISLLHNPQITTTGVQALADALERADHDIDIVVSTTPHKNLLLAARSRRRDRFAIVAMMGAGEPGSRSSARGMYYRGTDAYTRVGEMMMEPKPR